MAGIKDNVMLAYNGIEIYKTDIDILCDEYINSLSNPDMIYKSAVFNGLLDYIYKHSLKDILGNKVKNDYQLLNNIFYNIYLPICYKYNKTPTILQFSVLADIDNTTLSDIKSGIYRTDGTRVNQTTSQIVKKWYSVCESALLGKAIDESSIGGMFALKACYGYRDNVIVTETPQQFAIETPEQIAARHKQNTLTLPEKPLLE